MARSNRRTSTILNLGCAAKLLTNVLPTNGDVIRAFFFERKAIMNERSTTKVPTDIDTKAVLIPQILELWSSSSLPCVSRAAISKRIGGLIESINKLKGQPQNKLNSEKYKKNMDNLLANSTKLFDICGRKV